MKDHISAPDSETEFADLLLSGKTVCLKDVGNTRHIKLIESLKDKIEASKGVFEDSGLRLVTQSVMNGELAPMWDADFRDQTDTIGLLFWLEGLDKRFPPVHLPLGIRSGKESSLFTNLAMRLIDGESVFVAGCKAPEVFLLKMKNFMSIEDIRSTPVYNGQGRKLGYMTKPEDDTPTGYRFKMVRRI